MKTANRLAGLAVAVFVVTASVFHDTTGEKIVAIMLGPFALFLTWLVDRNKS